MISDKLIYVLNSMGWTLVGIVMTLSYQRIALWRRQRQHKAVRSPLSPQAYLGMIIVFISLISAAFSGAGQIQANRTNHAFRENVECQTKINASNAAVQAERSRRSQQDTDNADQFFLALNRVLQQPPGTPGALQQIENALTYYQTVYDANSLYRETHPIALLTSCGPVLPKK